MTEPGRNQFSARRNFTTLTVAIVIVALAGLGFGPRGYAIGAVVAFLWAVARFDNQRGTCLPLAAIFVLVVGVLMLLMALMAIVHGG